jgi:hypothetical protein
MGYPPDLVYTDLNVSGVRLSSRESAYQSGVATTPWTTTIGDPYDWSAMALAVPLSGGRIATVYYKEEVYEPSGTVVYGEIQGWYSFDCVITSGLTELGRTTIDIPVSGITDYDTDRPNTTRNGLYPSSMNFAFNVAAAGDYVVMGAAIFDLNAEFPTSAQPKWWGADWLVLLDCSGSTPVVADEYLRAEFSDEASSPPYLFPPTGEVEIRLRPLDAQRLVTVMLSPDYVGDVGESSLFSIKVSNGALELQDNGYPTTTGSYDFSATWDVFLGYDQASNVGLFSGNDEATFGFSINSAGTGTSFGGVATSWNFNGSTWYPWGAAGDYYPSQLEPGVFYGPVYTLPDTYDGNPYSTAKFRYTGSGSVEILDVVGPHPHPDFSWNYYWNGSPGSGWRCVEHNGKVVIATPATYWDGTQLLYDLWITDDAFGANPELYRFANLNNTTGIYGTDMGSGSDLTLVPHGGVLYMAINIPDAYESPYLLPGEDYGTIVLMTIVNFDQTDIDGELSEKRRKFWRNRPY